MVSRLIRKPKHYDSCVLGRWIRADVREVHVERDDGPAFSNANCRDASVSRAGKSFVEDGRGIMSASAEQLGQFDRQILVQLESQAELLSGYRDHTLLRQLRGVADRSPDGLPSQ